MPTITFIPLDVEPTPPTPLEGAGELLLFGSAFADLEALGSVGFGELPLLQANNGTPLALPVFGSGAGTLDLLAGYSFGALVYPEATGEGELLITGFAYETEHFGYGVLPLVGFGSSLDDDTPPLFLEDSLYVAEVLGLAHGTLLADTAVTRALLGMGSDISTESESTAREREALGLSLLLDAITYTLVSEGFGLAGEITATPRAVERAVERLMLQGIAASESEAVNLIVEALTLRAVEAALARVEIQESLGLADVVALEFQGVQAVIEGLLLAAQPTGTGTMVAAVSERIGLAPVIATEAEAFNAIVEGLNFVLRFRLDDHEYVAWAYGTQNAQLSRYRHFPFNSFGKLGGRYMGATPEGIFALEGADDAGEPIAAKIRGAMSDLGTAAMKRNPEAYLAYSAPTGLILRTITTTEEGDKVAHTYRLNAQPSAAVREARVKLGHGLESLMWGWEIENIDGGKIDVRGLQFHPVITRRKIRGMNGGNA